VRLPTPIETERLRLRPFHDDASDLDALLAVLGDSRSMRYYPAPFDRAGTRRWIERQLERYERDGFGLLVIEDRATGELIGDCGPTVQEADGESFVELGWHVLRARQRRGVATEAGAACRDAAFTSLDAPFLISLIRPEPAIEARRREARVRDLARHDQGRVGPPDLPARPPRVSGSWLGRSRARAQCRSSRSRAAAATARPIAS
jgi:ribosomal-protein-alanine N-acetyltransferase